MSAVYAMRAPGKEHLMPDDPVPYGQTHMPLSASPVTCWRCGGPNPSATRIVALRPV